MSEPLTLAELTAAIEGPLIGDEASIMRRIRHWTLSGALPTANELHAGTGRHRRYDQEAAYLAVVLSYLADWGLPIGVLKTVSVTIQVDLGGHDPEHIELWNFAKKGKVPVYLMLITNAEKGSYGNIFLIITKEEGAVERLKQSEQGLYLDLTTIFRSVKL